MREQVVVEVLRHLASGRTEPYQCRLDDGELYAVKGRNATTRGLIAEAVSAMLGRRFDLPIPDFTACSIPNDLLAAIEDPNVRVSLGSGICFASHWVEPADNLTIEMRKKVSDHLLASIYVFDHWIENGDRTLTKMGENVNLLFSLANERLIAIDHNLAFSDSHFSDDLSVHAGREAWKRVKDFVGFRHGLEARMASLIGSVDEIWDGLPISWTDERPDMLQRVKQGLERFRHIDFWNELG